MRFYWNCHVLPLWSSCKRQKNHPLLITKICLLVTYNLMTRHFCNNKLYTYNVKHPVGWSNILEKRIFNVFDTNMYKYRELQEFGQFLKVSVRFYGARETVGMRQNQSLQRNVSFSSFLSFSFSFSFFFLFFSFLRTTFCWSW